MSHPYSKEAGHTGRSKMRSIGKGGNLDIPIMRSVGENQSGGVRESSSSMQMKRQAGASGMKRGGRFGKHKSKTKPDMSAMMVPPPDAVSPPPPATPGAAPMGAPGLPTGGPPPMQKRGGKVKKYARGGRHYDDGGEVEATPLPPSPFEEVGGKGGGGRKPRPKPTPIPDNRMKRGGGLPVAGHNTNGGAYSGIGRLEKARTGRK